MKKILIPVIFVVILAVAGGIGYVVFVSDKGDKVPTSSGNLPEPGNDPSFIDPAGAPEALGAIQTIKVVGKNFEFSKKEIRVKRGETVKIVFSSETGSHNWTLDDFNAKTSQVNEGETEIVTFQADKVGSFEYYCSISNHRQMGMVGTLIVE